MNGLQPVSIRACKGFSCLPICPLGTRGTTLSRRLSQEWGVRWFTGGARTRTRTTMSKPIARIRRILMEPRVVSLDTKITGLTPLSVERRESPIRYLLKAIDNREDTSIWYYYSAILASRVTPRLSAADYSSILLSIRARRFVSLESRNYLNDNGEARLMPEDYNYGEFRRRLHLVSIGMQENGYRLGVMEYTHLLDCARAGNDKRMAESLWNQMAGEGVVPDTWSYNAYMAAMCGTASTERELRVSERTLSQRSASNEMNVRARAMAIYRRMTERGVVPNSMTFDILMLAMARMGDITSVRIVLKKVWDIDVDSLATSPDSPESLPPAMGRDSPLYPREHTLVSVAACFGSNNDIETAVRVVDHLARRYKLTISMATWTTLLNWTYVFTRPPIDILPKYSVMNLWQIMTSPPYDIKPTLEMYDYCVRSLIARKMAAAAETMINRGLKAYSRMRSHSNAAASTLSTALARFPGNNLSRNEIHTLKRKVAFAQREEFRGRSIIRRWIELLCLGKGMRVDHARIRVPNVIRRMGFFLGDNVRYVTQTGYVTLMRGRGWRAISVRRRKRMWTPLGTGAKEVDYFD